MSKRSVDFVSGFARFRDLTGGKSSFRNRLVDVLCEVATASSQNTPTMCKNCLEDDGFARINTNLGGANDP